MKATTQSLADQGPLGKRQTALRLGLILAGMAVAVVLGIHFFTSGRNASTYLDTPSALLPVGVNGLYGYIDPDGRWAIEPRFEAANVFAEDGGAWVQHKGKLRRIDTRGKRLVSVDIDVVPYLLRHGIVPASVHGKYGYMDAFGTWIISPRFDRAAEIGPDGFAEVQENDNVGYVDAHGTIVLEPVFKDLGPFNPDGLTLAAKAGEYTYGLVNAAGEWVVPAYTQNPIVFINGYARAHAPGNESLWGFLDENGRWAVEPTFRRVEHFGRNGLAPATQDERLFGYIDAAGKWVIEPVFHNAHPFQANGFALANGGKEHEYRDGTIDASGQWVIPPLYDELPGVIDTRPIPVRKEGKWGYINSRGNVLIPLHFESIRPFEPNGLAFAKLNGLWGVINDRGKWVSDPEWSGIGLFGEYSFHNGFASVSRDGLEGYIDEKGKLAVAPRFERALDVDPNGLAVVKQDGKWGVITMKGDWLVQPAYDSIGHFAENGLAAVEVQEKFGFIDSDGRWVVLPRYIGARSFFEGFSLVIFEGPGDSIEIRFIDALGHAIVPFDYVLTKDRPALLHWEGEAGQRRVVDGKGNLVLSLELDGEREIARNAEGRQIWP